MRVSYMSVCCVYMFVLQVHRGSFPGIDPPPPPQLLPGIISMATGKHGMCLANSTPNACTYNLRDILEKLIPIDVCQLHVCMLCLLVCPSGTPCKFWTWCHNTESIRTLCNAAPTRPSWIFCWGSTAGILRNPLHDFWIISCVPRKRKKVWCECFQVCTSDRS